MAWSPDGRRIRALRGQLRMSVDRLAFETGLGEKTIRLIESGETKTSRTGTLEALARVLGVDIKDIAREVDSSRSAKRGGKQKPRPWTPPASQLESLVDVEAASKRAVARLDTAEGPVEALTPKRYQDIMTAYRLHAGEKAWVTARVLRQRGIPQPEASLLGTRSGIGARFLVASELVARAPLTVTVFSTTAQSTRALQGSVGTETPVTLVLRVFVPEEESEPGFTFFGSQAQHPWALMVHQIVRKSR